MSDKPEGPLQAEDVKITRATISIQTVRVGKRQLTQSIFRQLQETELFDEATCQVKEGNEIWGWVSYRWQGIEEGARQYVVRNGSRLYRCPLLMRWSRSFNLSGGRLAPPSYASLRDAVRTLMQGMVWKAALDSERPMSGLRYELAPFGFFDVDVHSAKHKIPDGLYWPEAKSRIREALRKERFLLQTLDSWSPEDLQTNAEQIAIEASEWCEKWDALMDRLDAVEQLFIAC